MDLLTHIEIVRFVVLTGDKWEPVNRRQFQSPLSSSFCQNFWKNANKCMELLAYLFREICHCKATSLIQLFIRYTRRRFAYSLYGKSLLSTWSHTLHIPTQPQTNVNIGHLAYFLLNFYFITLHAIRHLTEEMCHVTMSSGKLEIRVFREDNKLAQVLVDRFASSIVTYSPCLQLHRCTLYSGEHNM